MRIVHSQIASKTAIRNRSRKFSPFVKQFSKSKKALSFIKTSETFWMQDAKIVINPMQQWQLSIKRTLDVICSIFSLVVLFPLLVFIAVRTKFSSVGPIFYFQERIGKKGKPFLLLKFRSMIVHAEKQGPQLSHRMDNRITPWGKTMRHWRLDELPQLWNILKGDMSFVGPRPERNFFVKQLAAISPSYKMLLHLKPGLSSIGMVRFGYAENIEEMLERSRYDLMYLKNPSIVFDIKVVFQTIKIIFFSKNEESH